MTKEIFQIMLRIFIGVTFLALSQMESEDQAAEIAVYCEMVDTGSWPAYRNDVECTNNKQVSK